MRYHRKQITPDFSLDEGPFVWGEGPDGPCSLAFIGEAPGTSEVEEGHPFVGQAGKVFSWGLASADIYRGGVWVDNVLPVKLPDNNWDHPDSQEALAHCLPAFWELIEFLIEKKGVRVIVPMGNHPKSLFGIEPSITKARGSIYIWDWQERQLRITSENPDTEVFVIPTYHPAYIARGGRWSSYGNKERGRADLTGYWISDLQKAKGVADGNIHLSAERFNTHPTEDDVVWLRDEVVSGRIPRLAVDIETTSLDPWGGSLVVIGFAWTDEDAMSVPLLRQGGVRYWKNGSHRRVTELLNDIFTKGRLVYQNAMYDVLFLRQHGYTHPMESVCDDTLLMHHAISPELPHNLPAIVSEYGTTPYWKADFLERPGNILDMPDDELRTYNLRDAVVLLQVIAPMEERLREMSSWEVYQEEAIPLLPVLCEMVETGVDLDEGALKKWKAYLRTEQKKVEKELYELANLPPEFSLSSPDDMRLFLFGTRSKKYDKVRDLSKKKAGTKVHKQLTDLKSVLDNTHPLVDLSGHRPRTTDKGKAATDKRALLSIQRYLQNRLYAINRFRRPTAEHKAEEKNIDILLRWIAKLNHYRRITKLRSTYTSFPTRADGRIHTEFVPTGTATGRLASRSPNLQNAPKGEDDLAKGVRRLFAAPPGWLVLAVDYSNLEVGTMAYECQDPELIRIFEEGLNMHDINTQLLFHIEPDHKLWKAARGAAKIFQFGSLSYGGGDNEVYEQIITKVPELRLTMKEFRAAKERYFEARPTYYRWRTAVEDFIVNRPEWERRMVWDDVPPHLQERLGVRWIANNFGRVRYFHGPAKDIHKEALNFPAQSDAAHIINRAAIDIYRRLRGPGDDMGEWLKLQAQIHDELRFLVREDHISDAYYTVIKPRMEREFIFYGRTVHFPVEAEYGPNWADLRSL